MKQCALSGCHRPALDDPQAQGYCILHAPWDGKDLSAFQAAIEEIIQEAQQGSGVCDFSHCYFPSNYNCANLRDALEFNCNFAEAEFSGSSIFSEAKFSERAFFRKAKFFGDANFLRANFFGDADFTEAEFFRDASFGGAEFSRDASFEKATFYQVADFGETKFSGIVDFRRVKCSKDVDFQEAMFFKGTTFGKANFSGVINFGQAKFFEGADFWGAEFSGYAYFDAAKFSKSAVFEEAKFSGDVYFTGAEFSGDAVFWRANFFCNAYFWGAKFFEYAIFEEAKLCGNTHFEGAEFQQRTDFSKVQTAKDATVDFQRARLLKPQQAFFHHVDLSRWSFLDTDLCRIDFDDVTWGTIRRLWSRRTALFDEIRVSDKKVEKEYLAKVERLYRHLKQNYESQRDYSRAGDFYYGEMEMKRRQLNPLGQIPFWIYRILSGYGESYPRALFWLIAMWLGFALLFTVVGYTDEWGNRADLWRSLIYSAQSMTLLREPKITFHNVYGQLVELVASVLGVIQIALFGLALQRRFKR